MLHKDAKPIDGVHVIHNWEVVDEAARLALVVAADDVGKVCWQVDTTGFYVLSAFTPSIIWTQLGEEIPEHPTAALHLITDTGAYFATDNVEAALQEIGGDLVAIDGILTNHETRLDAIEAAPAGSSVTALCIAASDETTALTAGVGKVTFRMPFAMTGVTVKASLTTAQTSGSIFTVDINEGGASILSTKLTIDNTEKTSATAAAPPVISDASLADDAEITIDIDQIGDGTAKGLKIYIKGTPA